MSSSIQIKNGNNPKTWARPAWQYNRPDSEGIGGTIELSQLEMQESIRNVLEDIRNSQMMQCDVAHAIKRMSKTLDRIDRRLAKFEDLKLKK